MHPRWTFILTRPNIPRPFFAAVPSRGEDYRERRSASRNAVERAPAFRLHSANGLRSSSVRPPFGFSRLLRRPVPFPWPPRPPAPASAVSTPQEDNIPELLPIPTFVDCRSKERQDRMHHWSKEFPPHSHRRRDDPSWREEASPRYAVVAVAPWPIGLRGCCIIYSPKQREEESERRIEQR